MTSILRKINKKTPTSLKNIRNTGENPVNLLAEVPCDLPVDRKCQNPDCQAPQLIAMVPTRPVTQFIHEPKVSAEPVLVNGYTTIFQVDGEGLRYPDTSELATDGLPKLETNKPIYRIVPNTHAHIVNYVIIDRQGETLKKIRQNDPSTIKKLMESQKNSAIQLLDRMIGGKTDTASTEPGKFQKTVRFQLQQSKPQIPVKRAHHSATSTSSTGVPRARPVDTPQSYAKGGAGPPPPPQQSAASRSAASPLSPPRPGPGAANTYPRFADVTAAREAPHRYVQQSPYSVGQMQQFRENPYARIPQVPAQMQEYHRQTTGQPVVVSGNSSLSVVSIGPAGTMDAMQQQQAQSAAIQHQQHLQQQQHQGPPSQQQQPLPSQGLHGGRQRISLIPPPQPQHPAEYMTSTRPAQAPPDPGGQPYKKLRLGESMHPPSQPPPQQRQQHPLIKQESQDHRILGPDSYHPQVEAISPTPHGTDHVEERRTTKDDLLTQIHKVDMEIVNAENTMVMLRKKEESLEEASARPLKIEEPSEIQPKHRSLAQKIYADNRKRAAEEHSVLSALGPKITIPLYNQPSDVEVCHLIIQRHQSFKSRLLMHLKKVKSEQTARNSALVDKYSQLSQEWIKRVEKAESSAKRKAKEAKNREFFEKVFTELRKQREDKERFNRVGSRIKSEADLEEIMDGLQEQAMEDKKMRSYAVIPPLMLEGRQRRCVYSNENGALPDMVVDFKERQNLNVWTAGEKEIFKEKFLQHPKNFGAIAASLDRKTAQDCVRYYYLSKKTENYKQLLRKSRQRTRSSRNPQKVQQVQTHCIVDSLTTGVTTRLQREQQQKTGGRTDRAAQSTSSSSSASSSTAAAGSTCVASTSQSSSVELSVASTSSASGTSAAATSMEVDPLAIPNGSSMDCLENESNVRITINGPTTSSSSSNEKNSKNGGNSNSAESLADTKTVSVKDKANPAASGIVKNSRTTGPSLLSSSNIANMQANDVAGNMPSQSSAFGTSSIATSFAGGSGPNGIRADLIASGMNAAKAMIGVIDKGNSGKDSGNNNGHPIAFDGSLNVSLSGGGAMKKSDSGGSGSGHDASSGENGDSYSGVSEAKKKRLNWEIDETLSNVVAAAVAACTLSSTSTTSAIHKSSLSSANQGLTSTSILGNKDGHVTLDSIIDNKEKLHPCFICKIDSCPRTRPLKKGRGQQYGISDDVIPSGARVCNSCQCKSVRNRYPNCPFPTCPNPKERAKRMHNIPQRLFELSPDMRDPILQEFQIPVNATRCCSACCMRIRRKLDPQASFTEDERRTMLTDESELSISSCDERDAASSDTASAESPNNAMRPGASQKDGIQPVDITLVPPSRKQSSFEDDRLMPPMCQAPRKQKTGEEYDSSATETADEENENSPANRQSPKVILHPSQTTVTMVPPSILQNGLQREPVGSDINVREIVFNYIERSVKTGGPAPKPGGSVMKLPPNSHDSRDITFVREYRNDMPPQKPPTPSSGIVGSNMQQSQQSRQLPHSAPSTDNLATLSVVNSHSHGPQQTLSHSHGITATITPVQSQQSLQHQQMSVQQMNSASSAHEHSSQKDEVIYSGRVEPEPQTLDLSIKKPSRDVQTSMHMPSHVKGPPPQQQHQTSAIPLYRGEPQPPSGPGGMPTGPPQNPTYIGYHHPADMNRPTKSPSVYVSQVPVPISIAQQNPIGMRSQPQMPPSQQQPSSSMGLGPQHMQSQPPPSQQSQMSGKQSKVTLKLSPKVHQQSPSPSNQMVSGGPKGSITHGSPVNSQQQIMVQGTTTLSPRFEGIMRQTPPSDSNKLGSITQGTPVHLPTHHLQDKQRVYEYYRPPNANNRQSPAQQPQPPPQQSQGPRSSPQAQNFVGSPYARAAYGLEQTPQLSSRQIVMHDYITSQQMHGQQGRAGRSDKESPSPRSSAMTGSPASIYYAEKDRGRSDYLSRTSPAEHINSTPSPHRTPPPQRQGVIQRHNTGGSKPPSPSPNRLHLMQHHYPPPGHEAFSSFVDVAVQQPQLPVPHKDEKRGAAPMTVDHPGPPLLHEIRYHQMAREHRAIQMHQQQQEHFRQVAVVDMQRRQEQYNRDRMQAQQERERERERQERERIERNNQERLQAERDLLERERKLEMQRERDRQEEREREREREERHRDTARLLAAGGGPPFLRGDPSAGRGLGDRDPFRRAHVERPLSDGTFTAATLIDAIIKHSINQGTSEPQPSVLGRDGPSRQFYPTREQPHPAQMAINENNGKSNSPKVINVELDPERGLRQQQNATKSITLGELTDSIITKDYGPNPVLPLRAPPYMAYLQEPIVTTDQWKYARRMQQKEAEAAEMRIKSAASNRSTTPDERHIIRMAQSAQPPSPRNKYHELVMPEGYYFQAQHAAAAAAAAHGGPPQQLDRRLPPGAGGNPTHQFDCYVKNKIVEAMRTEEDRRPDDGHSHPGHHDRGDGHRQATSQGKDMSTDGSSGGKSTPSSYEDGRRSGGSLSDSHIPPHGYGSHHMMLGQQPPPPPVTTFAATTYAYPFSALNVTGPPPTMGLGPQSKSMDGGLGGSIGSGMGISQQSSQQPLIAEPKPLLSSQYEALSDED